VQVLQALPADVRVLVKTTHPAQFFAQELAGRDVAVLSAEYDCGCVQSDSVTVLQQETLARYQAIARQNEAVLSEEVAFLRREKVQCVVSDIPSFPLRAAREAGIPGVAVANFTWLDIYREYVQDAGDARLLDGMAREYGQASLALITDLSLPETAAPFPHVKHVPLVARPGANIRERLVKALGLPPQKKIGLLYVGVWGLNIGWLQVEKHTDWAFITLELTLPPAANVYPLHASEWRYADVAASVDTVLAKTGYGTVTGCIAAGVPLIYPPRDGFAEHAVLADGLTRWGGGVPIATQDFLAGNWANALDSAQAARPDPHVFAINSAETIAAELGRFL